MPKELAIVLNNGSLNSAVITAMAAQKYRPILLHGEVIERPTSRLRMAYDHQVAHFKPYREHKLSMPFLTTVEPNSNAAAGSVDPRQQLAVTPSAIQLLPLVAIAIRFAVHYRAAAVYMGLRVGGHSDELAKATEYVQIWNEMISLPLNQAELELQTPLLELEAWQVVDVGANLHAPLEHTWSCLEDLEQPCGACRGCRVRDLAFQQSGKADPQKSVRK